jgi:hypothetical protein
MNSGITNDPLVFLEGNIHWFMIIIDNDWTVLTENSFKNRHCLWLNTKMFSLSRVPDEQVDFRRYIMELHQTFPDKRLEDIEYYQSYQEQEIQQYPFVKVYFYLFSFNLFIFLSCLWWCFSKSYLWWYHISFLAINVAAVVEPVSLINLMRHEWTCLSWTRSDVYVFSCFEMPSSECWPSNHELHKVDWNLISLRHGQYQKNCISD